MEIINKDRGMGKTTQLIHMANEQNIPIIVANPKSREYVKYLANKLGYPNTKVFSLYEMIPSNETKILIDEIEIFLDEVLYHYFGNVEVVATTMTVPMESNYE